MVITVATMLPRRSKRMCVVILAGFVSAACSGSSSSMSEAVAESSKSVSDAASAAATKMGLMTPSAVAASAKTETKPAATAKPAAPARPPAQRPSPARHADHPVVLAPAKETPSIAPEAIDPAPPPALPAVSASEEEAVAAANPSPAAVVVPPVRIGSPIYSPDDPDVTPAVLLTTKEAGPVLRGMHSDMNTMELIVSELGRVEEVRLLTPAKRMTDMLLLSGAKTWRFSPAVRNGQPVRYRTMFSWPTVP